MPTSARAGLQASDPTIEWSRACRGPPVQQVDTRVTVGRDVASLARTKVGRRA